MDRREVKGIKEAVRLRGVTHPISPPPLNTPLVRMDKGTIRLRWIYNVMIASTF
jgi:hypothetical protein